MIKTDELFSEVMSLPVEIRTQLINKLPQSINPFRKDVDELWAKEVEKRVEEIRSGEVKTVPGEEVFKKIRDRLNS